MTAPARDSVCDLWVGTKKRAPDRTKKLTRKKDKPLRTGLTKKAPYKLPKWLQQRELPCRADFVVKVLEGLPQRRRSDDVANMIPRGAAVRNFDSSNCLGWDLDSIRGRCVERYAGH